MPTLDLYPLHCFHDISVDASTDGPGIFRRGPTGRPAVAVTHLGARGHISTLRFTATDFRAISKTLRYAGKSIPF